MPFERPQLAALVSRVRSDLRGRLGLSLVRRAMSDVLAAVWGGAVHMLHGHLEWTGRQLFPDTSEREHLLRQAALYGIYPTPATFAAGSVTATGTNGSTIEANTLLQGSNGLLYEVDADATISGGVATLAVTAMTAGAAGNLGAGEAISFESPVAGVDAAAVVAAGGIGGGFEEEETEGTRARLLLRLREPPQGGADQDYEAWALAVAGVTRAWVYPNGLGLGTVVVRMMTDDPVTGETGFPDSATVDAVQAKLDEERPITAEVTAEAPTPLEVDFEILVTPDTAAVRAAVAAELADLLYREAEPGNGAGRGTILLSRLQVAIGVADGVEDFTLVAPAADVVPATGELPILGTVDWGS